MYCMYVAPPRHLDLFFNLDVILEITFFYICSTQYVLYVLYISHNNLTLYKFIVKYFNLYISIRVLCHSILISEF